MTPKLALMASGRGSNVEALIQAIRSGQLKASVGLLVSDHPEAPVVGLASRYDIPLLCPVSDFEREAAAAIRTAECDLIVLAGFMRLLKPSFVEEFAGRILNIHPSLLPRFRGLHPQRQALRHRATLAGCTVHLVTSEVDAGPIIAQRVVWVQPDDTEESLAVRILHQEHKLLAEAIRLYAEQRL